MKTEIIQVTPEMAKEMLSKNVINRKVSFPRVEEYRNQIETGTFLLTHQGIAFYEDGTLADGQHRLLAIIKANKPVCIQVTTGLPKSAATTIDQGRSRSLIDGVRIEGTYPWIAKVHISIVPVISFPKRLTNEQKLAFICLLKPHMIFATQCFLTNRKHLSNSVIQAAIVMAHYHGVDEVKLIRFAEVLANGQMGDKNEKVIIMLREYLLNNTSAGELERREKFLKIQRAIQAYVYDENIKRLCTPSEEIYTSKGLF